MNRNTLPHMIGSESVDAVTRIAGDGFDLAPQPPLVFSIDADTIGMTQHFKIIRR